MLVFFDDILVISKDLNTHLQHLRKVLGVLQNNHLYAKKSKCSFGCAEVGYLGHLIFGQGVRDDLKKNAAMVQWPIPTSVKALRGFFRSYRILQEIHKGI